MKKRTYLVFVFILPAFLQVSPAFSQSSLVGVWKAVDLEYQSPDTAYHWPPQPQINIFTEKYFSMAYVGGPDPRPLLPKGVTKASLTEEQLRAVYLPYNSSSGTYEVTEDEITFLPIVHIWPNNMEGEKGKRTGKYEIEGDSHYLIWHNGSGVLKVKFVRLE